MNAIYFLPMHKIAILVYPGFELLDASGPASVFAGANRVLAEYGHPPFYVIEIVSPFGGEVISSSGVKLQSVALSEDLTAGVDTFLVAGAFDHRLQEVSDEEPVRRWVPLCAAAARRFGSICTGAFVFAALGF